MKERLEKYEILSYQLNPNVVKGLNGLNISMQEFLLLLYFLNNNCALDMEDINNKVSLSNDEIINAYSSLQDKNLIEIKMEKVDGKYTEIISLDNFYNKLILKEKDKSQTGDIYSKFESEFGKPLSPIEYDTINKWLENSISEEVILDALRDAVLAGAPRLNYIDKIIYDRTKKGEEKEEYKELYDFNWINEDE